MQFQPQLDVATESYLTVEALVRWQHPVHGLLGPDQFIGLAESAGLIRPLTLHVLELALEAASGWRRQGWDVGVAVNLSARQLTDHSLPIHLTERLAHWRLPPSRLVVEVTESSLMDVHQASSVLRALRDIGIRLSIDDFGTGYSSLVRLQRLDVDELKIDKSFVGGLLRGGNDEILVRSIVELAHNLGLQVVAEGVETDAVAEHLRRLGCDRLQGFLLGRPMHHEAVTALLAAQHVRGPRGLGYTVPAPRPGPARRCPSRCPPCGWSAAGAGRGAVLIVALFVLGLALVPLTGGRWRGLVDLRLRLRWLVLIAFALQFLVLQGPAVLDPVGPVLHVLTYGAAGVFVWANRRVPGLLVDRRRGRVQRRDHRPQRRDAARVPVRAAHGRHRGRRGLRELRRRRTTPCCRGSATSSPSRRPSRSPTSSASATC